MKIFAPTNKTQEQRLNEIAKAYQRAVNDRGERIGFETALREVRQAFERTRKATLSAENRG